MRNFNSVRRSMAERARLFLPALVLGAMALSSTAASADPTYTLVYGFAGQGTDPVEPEGGLILGSDGNLYIAGTQGTVNGGGGILKYDVSTSTQTVLTSFHGPGATAGGWSPWGALYRDSSGNIFGANLFGGSGTANMAQPTNGPGTLFEYVASTGQTITLHSFLDGSVANDGVNPYGGVMLAPNGKYYGVTYSGGSTAAPGDGTIYCYDPSTSHYSVVHSFGSTTHDGRIPLAGMILGSDGYLYGTTEEGGTVEGGTIYRLNPSNNAVTVLHSFNDGSVTNDGIRPQQMLLQGADGNLYGNTFGGGADNAGAVFKYNLTTGALTILHSFTTMSAYDGISTSTGLAQTSDGCLVGGTYTHQTAGTIDGNGVVYKLNPSTGAISYFTFTSSAGHQTLALGALAVMPDDSIMVATHGSPNYLDYNTTITRIVFPPTSTACKAGSGHSLVNLSWKAVPSAKSYTVNRSTSPGTAGAVYKTGVTALSLHDTAVTNNVTYYYTVSAVNPAGTGPASPSVSATPTPPATASFVKVDTTTLGNWRDSYGSDGYNVVGDTSTNNPHYRDYVSATPGTHNSGLWVANSLAPTCLQTATAGSARRLAGVWFQTSWTLNVNTTGTRKLALYLLDQPNAGYAETITVKDALTGAVLDTRAASNFSGGAYYVWNVTGNVNITFTATAGHWAVLSGIFFGSAPGSKEPAAPTSLAIAPIGTALRLSWTASAGATSYNVYRGTSSGGESPTPIATGVKTTSYINTGLTSNVTYYYKVIALNAYGGSFASEEASDSSAPPPPP